MATLKEKKRKLKKMRARNIILNMVCVCLAVSGLWWTITYLSSTYKCNFLGADNKQ